MSGREVPPENPIVECAFFVPLVRNGDKKPHRPLVWDALDDALFVIFHGATGPEQVFAAVRPVPGQYRGRAGERIRDQSYRYLVAIPESRLEELRALLRRVANTFDQECIYLAVRGVVEFVEATPEAGFLTEE